MKTNKTIWTPVRVWKNNQFFDYTNKYEVSDGGEIRSMNWRNCGHPKIMKPQSNGTPYLMIGFRNGGKKEHFFVQRVVWQSFNGKIPDGMQINHKDCNPKNNRLDNLEVVTAKENCNYGERSIKQRLSQLNNKASSKPVKQFDLNGNLIRIFPSQKEAERVLREEGISVTSAAICNCCNKKKYFKTAGGFIWRSA